MKKTGYINGLYKDYSEMTLHVSDLSIHRGYGVFDFMLERKGNIPFIGDYIERFVYSAKGLQLALPCSKKELEEIIRTLVKKNGFHNSGIKLLLTGGFADDGYTPSSPNFMVINHPFILGKPENKAAAKLITADYQRDMPEIKTINYLTSVSLIPKMKAQGAMDVLFRKNGFVYECSRCNFFMVKGQTLITPCSGMLKGITRKNVLKLAKEICRIEERDVLFAELMEADEAFITCTTKEVMPIIQIDDLVIGDGAIGKVTTLIGKKYNELLSQ